MTSGKGRHRHDARPRARAGAEFAASGCGTGSVVALDRIEQPSGPPGPHAVQAMKQTTYTMSVRSDGEVVAQGVTLCRALVLALEHGGEFRAVLVERNFGSVRRFEIGRRRGRIFRRVLSVTVPRSADPGADADRAMKQFGKTLLENPRLFWRGRIETDEDFVRRTAAEEVHGHGYR